MKNTSITTAIAKDVSALQLLVNSAYRGEESKKGWTTEEAILDGIRIDEPALEALLNRTEVAILKYTSGDGHIIGTVCLELKGTKLYLGMFAVSPAQQGGGIGKALMKSAEEFALSNHCDRIVISVISSRMELIDWYKRHGYVATGAAIAFDEIEGRFGEPKVAAIQLIEMEKLLHN